MKQGSPFLRSKMLLIAGMLALSVQGISQNPSIKVFEDWNTTSGTQNNFQRSIVRSKTLGGATYYYTCGSTLNSAGNYDLFVQKKNSSGVILWTQTYNGAGNGNDYAADAQIDAVGNVYICGTYYKDATDSNNAVIIKYNTAGTHKWTKTYNGAGSRHDAFAALQVSGNVVVAVGTTWKNTTNMFDMLVMRADSNANTVWTQTWDHVNLNDVAVNLWNSGTKIYIAGGAQSAVTTYKYAVVNVKASDGSIQGSTVTGGTAFGFDQLTDIQYDANGYIYLTGGVINTGTIYDIKTVKLDTALNIIWSATYASSGAYNDIGTGLAIDQVGNVIVTGYRTSATTGQDYVTIKYSSGGTQRWVATYDGGLNAQDSATSVVVNPTDTNKIYVTGLSYNGSSKDYWTLKYDGLGNLKWDIGFNNIYNTDDRALAIAIDTMGNLIVVGQNKLNDTTHTYTTVKYIEKTTLLPDDTIPASSNSFVFTENRDQLLGTDSALHAEVKFYCTAASPSVYFMDTAVSYVFFKEDTTSANVDSLYRIDMKFVNSNSDQKIRAFDNRSEFSSFYLGHIPEGRCQVQNYNKLVSFNVWNNVDVLYGSNQKGLKTYFTCKPGGGGNPAAQIDLLYEDADSVIIDASGNLIIYSPYGNLVQPKACAWQIDGSGNFLALAWQPTYTIVGTNEVKFASFGSYNTAYPLIIAMDWGNEQFSTVTNPSWSTYLGSPSTDYGWEVEYSGTEVLATGSTPMSGFPVYNGYDLFHNGGHDLYVASFDNQRARRWVTYYGGSGSEEGRDLTSVNGFVFLTGSTQSDNFPVSTPTGYYGEGSLNSTTTAFILMLNPFNGFRMWATRFGRDNTEGIKILADPFVNDQFYVAGTTTNVAGNGTCAPPTNTGFPLCNPGSGAYYDGTANGGQDAFICRFSNFGQLTWCTFFGGPGADEISDLEIDANGKLYAVGYTTSSSGIPVQAPPSGSYYQNTFSGVKDGVVIQFDLVTLIPEWCTYIGGANAEEITGMDISPSGSIYVVGFTGSPADVTTCATPTGGGFPTCGASQAYNTGNSDAFILKFKNYDLTWGTYLGGTGAEGFGLYNTPAITHDAGGNMYVAMSSHSPQNSGGTPAVTQYNAGMNFNESNCNDVSVPYYNSSETVIYSFTSADQMLWGSYFGGEGCNPTFQVGDMVTGIDCRGTRLIITGFLHSVTQFPVVGPYAGSFTQGATTVSTALGGQDVFITEFDISQIPNVIHDTTALSSFNVGVAPNPSQNGGITVTINSRESDNFDLKIFNVLGDVVYVHGSSIAGDSSTQLDVSGLSAGIYFIHVTNQEGITETVKIAVDH